MTLKEKAIKLAWLINDEGHTPSCALSSLGFDEPGVDFFAEWERDVDDPENDVIDLSWENGVSFTLKRVWHATSGTHVWETFAHVPLTNHSGTFEEAKL